jgi:acyl carrier protein
MMKEKIFELVKSSLEELNEELEYSSLRDVSWETSIAGGESNLDSLSLVTLIVGLETKIERTFNKKILLADEKAMSVRNSPFRNMGSLVNFIAERLETGDA